MLLLTSVAWAVDDGQTTALHALRDEFHATSNRATPEELAKTYAAACQNGWRPACDPEQWRNVFGTSDPQRLSAFLEPVCEGGDALACYVLHRFVEPRFDDAALAAQCNAGFAPACTATPEGAPDRVSRLRRGCTGIDGDLPFPTDPHACTALEAITGDASVLVPACQQGDGRACRKWAQSAEDPEILRFRTSLGCDGGDAESCLGFAASYADRIVDDDELPDPADAQARGARHAAIVRACALGNATGCTEAGFDRAQGRGVPIDLRAAHDDFWRACGLGDGAGCAALAEAILDGDTDAFGLEPRKLFDLGCNLGNPSSCRREKNFDREQRLKTRRLLRRGYARFLPFATVRPWLGGSAGLQFAVSLPKVDAYKARRQVSVLIEQGTLDFTFGVFDRRDTPENVSRFALDWRQIAVPGKPWGVLAAVGTEWWEGAPRFSDAALIEAVPGEATETFDLTTLVLRADMERTGASARGGLRVSLSSISGWETEDRSVPAGTVGRLSLSLFRRTPTTVPQPMRGGASELTVYAGVSEGGGLEAGTPHVGAWFRDRRSWPLLRTRVGRDALSILTDLAAGVRQGDVPFWLGHYHRPRFSPNVGSWQLLRGQPVALMRGVAPVRARAGVRWWVGEYHGLAQHVGLYVTPFIEAGTVVPDLRQPQRTWWRSDGGLSATLTWRRRLAVHLEARLVTDLDNGGFEVAPSLMFSHLLEPWD